MSRKEQELNNIIQQQQEQLIRYKRKLQDLVQAYKSLQKEKEALKSSFEAVAAAGASGNKAEPVVTNGTAKNQHSDVESNASLSQEFVSEAGDDESLDVLKSRISTLSASLATISKEKSRIESAFQNDRKQLLLEKDELQKSLAAACQQAESADQRNTALIQSLKSQLVDERASHERELEGQQNTIKELQRTCNEERLRAEALERKNRDLSSSLEATKSKLDSASQPTPLIAQLQAEMDALRLQLSAAFQQEADRVLEVEHQTREQIEAHESCVATLESKLAELSVTLGEYERLRQQDLECISTLKEQLTSVEVHESSPDAKGPTGSQETLPDFNTEVQHTIASILKLKDVLTKKNEQLKQPLDLESIFLENGIAPGPPVDHTLCLMEFQRLKEEMDSLRRENESFQTEPGTGVDAREIERLSVKAKNLGIQLAEAYLEHQEVLQELREAWTAEREALKEEVNTLERDNRRRIVDLEYQVEKQRERTLALLEDKDQEIANLKAILSGPSLTGKGTPENVVAVLPTQNCPPLDVAFEITGGASASGGQILHYVEDLSRKEVELTNLRRIRRQLENALRELQLAHVAKENKSREETEKLKDQICRLERNQSREAANMEYLKNVVMGFLTQSDSKAQAPMLNAISTILEFSPKEVKAVQKFYPTWKH